MNTPTEPEQPGDEATEAALTRPPALSPSMPAGSLAEYTTFYKSAVPQLTAYIMAVYNASKREAAECAHEALVQYLHHRTRVQHPMAWCRQAAKSTFLKRMYDAVESFAEIPATGAPLYQSDNTEDPDKKQRATLLPLIAQLAPRQREVVTLVLASYSHKEIAEELNLTEDVVRSNLRHAKERLTELYDAQRTKGSGEHQ
ncbi:RNA polymerase sigma factor [Actinomycetospora straminea]|uniref:RNA polymerase sigma factor 70 region 4 type 2 domain-containing protein n=1 Tax=Actinomycetospora straminea TaxID=663607 RepID=A0ABP9F995_9PSEU|nr:sigma-70 family RNA polymerase sigma factor [Actinomycetospora straminea]MDD7936747.1 sigma-70 family RNA polymerase sigma factor [Actinomycetospora straminea]